MSEVDGDKLNSLVGPLQHGAGSKAISKTGGPANHLPGAASSSRPLEESFASISTSDHSP